MASEPNRERSRQLANEALWKRIPPVSPDQVRHHLADAMFGEQRAKDNAHWWRQLSGEEQRALIDTYPHEIGNAAGIPPSAHTAANEHTLNLLRDELQSRKDAGERLNRSERKELKRYDELRRALDEVHRYADEHGHEVHILAFEPHAFGGDGRMVVSIGHDPHHADSVSWHVPGYSTTIDSLGTNLTNARNHLASVLMENPNAKATSIAWIGYDAPQGFFKGLWDVGHSKLARAGGNILHSDISAFNAARDASAGDGSHFSDNHVFGHSYGSTTTSFAGHDGRLADHVRTVTLAGSPGAGPLRHASDFGIGENVFVASSSRDWITTIGGTGSGRFLGFGLGHDPAMASWGATRIAAEFPAHMDTKATFGTHTAYYSFDPTTHARSESLANFGRIAAGHPERVTLEGHRTESPPSWPSGKHEPAIDRRLQFDEGLGKPKPWDPTWHAKYGDDSDRALGSSDEHGPGIGHDDPSTTTPHELADTGRCAHDVADYHAGKYGRDVHLETEPGPQGVPARKLFEALGSQAHEHDYNQVRDTLLQHGDGASATLASKWAGAGEQGGHAYTAENHNGKIHLVEHRPDGTSVRSGWPPHWGQHAVEKTAVGYFDPHGNPVDPLTGRHGELRAAEGVGDVAGKHRLESHGPGHPAEIIEKSTGRSVSVSRAEHVVEYPPGSHPDFPAHAVTETHRAVGSSEARYIQTDGETARVKAVLRDVYESVDRPHAENKLTRLLSRLGFHGGHVIGFRFLLDQGGVNLFRQSEHFNDPVYKKMENEWASWIKNGARVEVTVDLKPPGADPEHVIVKYDVFDQHGAQVYYDRVNFENNEHQRFRRLPTREIKHRLDMGERLHQGTLAPLSDPVRAGHPHDVGQEWFRGKDHPEGIDPHYGDPLGKHWSYPHDPTDPARMNSEVAAMYRDPSALFGRDEHGNAYTQGEYEARFNTEGPGGSHWMNFPGNDGAVPGSRVLYTDAQAFVNHYGPYLDRIGQSAGKYLGVMEGGHPASWEQRAMHVDSLKDPYSTFTLQDLPAGWKIEVSEIAPGCGQPGGGLQVRIIDNAGEIVPVSELVDPESGYPILAEGGPT
ncbi:alpha/beta hydrolase [Mycobacterium sp. pUA109]|uniref:alpha/beta hydrolase n=1 Tax=Mycobacterium sp. pUA109 TaxID=3238982 RepID=UPI00351B51A5